MVSAHIFHILVSQDGSTSSHWGTKSGAFCEAVNWLLCNSNQEGKFLFYAVMLVPTYRFPSHGFICLHWFLFAMLVSVYGSSPWFHLIFYNDYH